MNNYHIYPDPIGRGKFSTVYKARMKRTIQYFAIKSVDKSQRSKVLQEVRVLHSLDHPNVLKFHAWYETSAHLWLVLEYCVGGELYSLLRQDRQLPEDSIHDFAYDLAIALQFLHSNGIIYCDLKPSNVLLDENGRIKLCHFGLAKKLTETSKTSSSALSQGKRGTPSYMAPELFQDGGFHSYASDLWALGCVLYECYAGRPPFVGREFTQLARSILSDPPPPLPGTPNRQFVNLINSLLVKDPVERIKWSDLCGHAFWRKEIMQLTLPSHPAFDNLMTLSRKPYLSESNVDRRPSENKTPPRFREKVSRTNVKRDENLIPGAGERRTPQKGISNGRRAQAKSPTRAADVNHQEPSSATKAVNILRLSRIAKSNLHRENEKENYRRPLANGAEKESEVKIENTDMELDFTENLDEEPSEECEATENPACSPETNISDPANDQQNGDGERVKCQHNDVSALTEECEPFEHVSSLDHGDATPSPVPASPQIQGREVDPDHGIEPDTSSSSSDLSGVLWHPSDLSVRPVMPGRKADKTSDTFISLPFAAMPASEFLKMSNQQVDSFSSKIVTLLNGNASTSDKQLVIRYLETLSNNRDAANILINGPITLVLVKMLRQSKASALRVQLASLIGLLIRHSVYIENELASSGILGALANGLRDKQDKVRRFSMAALGELLFYVSSQSEQPRDNGITNPQSKEVQPASGWQVPNALISLVSSVLRKGEDDTTQLYALRTMENIFSQGAQWVARFTNKDVISNLCYIFRAPGKQENMKLTAGSCLVRLVRFNPSTIQSIVERLSFKDIAHALVKGSPREQQISLNLLNMAMLGSHTCTNIGRYMVPLIEDKSLLPGLVSLLEQGSEVLRGKALIFVALLCKNGKRWLSHFFCSGRLLSVVDRLAREKDGYLQQSLDAFAQIVSSTVPSLLDTITGDIQQIVGGGRRHHVHGATLTTRNSPKTNIHLFPAVLHLLGSSCFRSRVATRQVLQHLTNLVKLAELPFQGRDDFQITLLRVLESITEEQSVVLETSQILIHEVLPSLSILYKGNKDGDARFLCLKILFDVMVIFLNEPFEDTTTTRPAAELKSLSNTHFLPLYPLFIKDEDPIPMYAQKLLVMLIESNVIKIPDILNMKTVQQCFEFLLGDLSSANVSNIKLCLALASAPELETKVLSQLKVVRRIGNLLEFVNAREMDDFMEPTLELCRAFLLRSMFNKNFSTDSKEPNLLTDGHSSELLPVSVDQQQCIRDISDFGSNLGVLLELSSGGGSSSDSTVSDIASECVVLLLKVAPREAATGFLTNLSKVTVILESWKRGGSGGGGVLTMIVKRMLHALGYSCRQVMLHGVILSISTAEINKLRRLVSEMKSSSENPDISNAASLVAIDLGRLPRS